MKEKLSLDDHHKVAAELKGIDEAISRILTLASGKVPNQITRQLCTGFGLDKALVKFELAMENEMLRHHVVTGGDNPY